MKTAKHRMLRLLCIVAAGAAGAWVPAPSPAQAFPAKPIRVIVPFPPGGADVTARIVLPKVQEDLGQPVTIENRAGANGIIGTDFMIKQPPDGYTLLWTASNPIVTAPVTTPKETPYDPVRDMTHISKLLAGVTTVAVPSSLPVDSMKELIEYAKRNPGKLSFASVGVGSSQHMDGEILKLRAGIDMIHVPYKGFGQVLPDLVAGRVQLAFIAYLSAVTQVNAGKLKILALATPYARMPGTPTVDRIVPGWERVPNWSASVHGPAGLPRPVVNRIHASLTKVLLGSELKKKFEDDGYIITVNTPEAFVAEVKESLAKTAAALRTTGIKVQ